MILPKGEAVYENLRTSFVDLNSFLQSLKEDDFTGYVQLSFWDYEGALFLEAGEIVNAIEEAKGTIKGGEEAVENIIHMSKQKDGRINVHRLAPEMVTILASTSMEEAIYKDLSTEFTSLDKLIEKLSKERHSGYIDITLKDNKGRGIIFFQEGEVAEAMMSGEGGGGIYGKEMLTKIIDDAQNTGATFNVYRAGLLESGAERVEIAQAMDLQGAIEVMQEVMEKIEDLVDGLTTRKGSFRDGFKRSQVEKSEDYPFLDPFIAEFEYENGEIKFWGKVPVGEFVQGIKDCIDLTLERIPVKIPRDELYARINSTLKLTIEKYGERIEVLGLKSVMPEILGP
ncbi:MAG: hypothetical protein JRI46_11865 [Deltaproteobacteria bacterium]|nr:hypothetical protein [Deltaproteobacteria bacterium]